MTGLNRGRYTVQQGGPWRLYTNTLPNGWTAIGTIQRGFEIGALCISEDGVYAQINSGAVRPLDQRKTVSSLTGQSRHSLLAEAWPK